jgi:hypothetical protein
MKVVVKRKYEYQPSEFSTETCRCKIIIELPQNEKGETPLELIGNAEIMGQRIRRNTEEITNWYQAPTWEDLKKKLDTEEERAIATLKTQVERNRKMIAEKPEDTETVYVI